MMVVKENSKHLERGSNIHSGQQVKVSFKQSVEYIHIQFFHWSAVKTTEVGRYFVRYSPNTDWNFHCVNFLLYKFKLGLCQYSIVLPQRH